MLVVVTVVSGVAGLGGLVHKYKSMGNKGVGEKEVWFQVRVPESLKVLCTEVAKKEGITLAEWAREVLEGAVSVQPEVGPVKEEEVKIGPPGCQRMGPITLGKLGSAYGKLLERRVGEAGYEMQEGYRERQDGQRKA